jgi:RHS repeat-associated protein
VDQNGNVLARYTATQNIDEPLAELRGSTTSYCSQDGLGSVTSLTTSAGALGNNYTYDSFGKLNASTGSIVNRFQYTGRDFDAETGLYNDRARYYSTNSGRFISEDPIGFDGGVNFYSYVGNRAPNFDDPRGLSAASGNDGCNACKIPYHLGSMDVDQNVSQAKAYRLLFFSGGLGTGIAANWFYNQVRGHGPWDYKQDKSINDFGLPDPRSPFEDFGNFNFGATAAALGIPEDVALRGAGWASTQADPGRAKQLGHWWGAPPYGDDPDDQVQIELGYNYVRLNCHQ